MKRIVLHHADIHQVCVLNIFSHTEGNPQIPSTILAGSNEQINWPDLYISRNIPTFSIQVNGEQAAGENFSSILVKPF